MRKIPNKMVMALCAVFVMPLSGCITSQGNFTAVSTRDIDWSRAGEFKQGMEWIEGRDAYYIIIIIPTKSHVLIDRAVENTLDKVPGAVALLDVSVDAIGAYIPFLYGKAGFRVYGHVLVDPELAEAANAAGESLAPYLAFYTDDGETFVRQELSAEEYRRYTARKVGNR